MVRFGPSGNSPIFYNSGFEKSVDAPKFLASIGLNAYEYSFGRGYNMSFETAKEIGANAEKNDILISVHAPFYINLANPDEEKVQHSFDYILKGIQYLQAMKGKKMVVHIASQGKLSHEEAFNLASERLDLLLKILHEKNISDVFICPETMGKYSQIGNPKEIIDLCSKDELLMPTFDFGHINCLMQGSLKTKEDYKKIFDYCFEKLGEYRTKNCHIHFSKIEFGAKGEIKHLNYDDKIFGPEFDPLAEVIVEYGLTPTIICESKDFMAEDALIMQRIYNEIKEKSLNDENK